MVVAVADGTRCGAVLTARTQKISDYVRLVLGARRGGAAAGVRVPVDRRRYR